MSAAQIAVALQRRQAVGAARMSAAATAVEINHRYRMARIEAEQAAIRERRMQNFWKSRPVRRTIYLSLTLAGMALGWQAAHLFGKTEEPQPAFSSPAGQHGDAALIGADHPTGREATGTVTSDAASSSQGILVSMDAVEVPFVRDISSIRSTGMAAVRTFAAVNATAQRFAVTGIYAAGEAREIGRERALSVSKSLQALGVSADRIEILPPLPSANESDILPGARLLALGHPPMTAQAIKPGSPLDMAGIPALPFNPAFALKPTPLKPMPETAELVAKLEPEAPAGAELETAVQAAASRNRPSSQGAPAKPLTRPDGPGVFVSVAPRTPVAAEKTPAPATTPAQPVQKSPSYEIVSRLEDAVLVKVGNQVRHVRVGQMLPDGKVLGKDLMPVPER